MERDIFGINPEFTAFSNMELAKPPKGPKEPKNSGPKNDSGTGKQEGKKHPPRP